MCLNPKIDRAVPGGSKPEGEWTTHTFPFEVPGSSRPNRPAFVVRSCQPPPAAPLIAP